MSEGRPEDGEPLELVDLAAESGAMVGEGNGANGGRFRAGPRRVALTGARCR